MPRKSGIGTGDYQIAELSVGLELDLKQLDLDAAVADKTVLEMITKMNHRAKQIEKTPVRVSRGLLLGAVRMGLHWSTKIGHEN